MRRLYGFYDLFFRSYSLTAIATRVVECHIGVVTNSSFCAPCEPVPEIDKLLRPVKLGSNFIVKFTFPSELSMAKSSIAT